MHALAPAAADTTLRQGGISRQRCRICSRRALAKVWYRFLRRSGGRSSLRRETSRMIADPLGRSRRQPHRRQRDDPRGRSLALRNWLLSFARRHAEAVGDVSTVHRGRLHPLRRGAGQRRCHVLGACGQCHAQITYVGDPYHEIDEWRGADNAMAQIDAPQHGLSRFGKQVRTHEVDEHAQLGQQLPARWPHDRELAGRDRVVVQHRDE